MKSLKSIVQRKLVWLAGIMTIIILLVAVLFQIISIQSQERENAEASFVQVEKMIDKSADELDAAIFEYRNTCLLNAEVISYVIDKNPEILGDVDQFRLLARKLEVDEIHIFNTDGVIFTGTHPEYFTYSVLMDGQISYFRPMLEDKRLKLCQDITPNTAEGKLVQYSAIWSTDGNYIVQVGMYPDTILEITDKNDLSYVFSLLRGAPGVTFYAIDAKDGSVIGSPAGAYNDKSASEMGWDLNETEHYERGAHVKVNGVNSYCFFYDMDGTFIAYVISNDQLYNNVPSFTGLLALCLLVIASVMVIVVKKYTDKYIIGSISATNVKLRAVESGKLDERVSVESSQEFSELSSHINSMIKTLLSDTDKMSLVLNRTNLHIGVYEYNTKMKNVRFTEHTSEVFGLNSREMRRISEDYRELQAFLERLRSEPVEGEENTYRFMGNGEKYIKLEEFTDENDVLGIVMDVTEEIVSRKKAEAERDVDLMTGLFNRRGMERKFEKIFASPKEMGSGALVMIDSDNLKDINDTYGHPVGDIYLKNLAEVLSEFEAPNKLAARVGGDEFVLLIYGYENNYDTNSALQKISDIQDSTFIKLQNGKEIRLSFSFGYELLHGRSDYERMLSAADVHMYNSKRERKKLFKKND